MFTKIFGVFRPLKPELSVLLAKYGSESLNLNESMLKRKVIVDSVIKILTTLHFGLKFWMNTLVTIDDQFDRS